jgi:deoxyadenosine/deoxycytidine kinase
MRKSERPRAAPAALRAIAIEGPIGVGKTSLARRIAATYDTELVLEGASANPFLAKFYADPARFALPAQLHFLFQRVEQLQAYRQNDLFRSAYISDYMLEKDRLFARLTLEPAEFDIYELIYQRVVDHAERPDLVIYLHASIPRLLDRIARRGIDYEQSIDRDYLDRLCGAYAEFFHNYDIAPVLIVNTDDINFVDGDDEFEQLLARIDYGICDKQYFEYSLSAW